MPLDQRVKRDELVAFCVKHLKFTAAEIHEFSLSWPFPFHDEQGVWRRLKALKLDGRVKRVAEQSLHDRMANKVVLKIWKDAARNGVTVTEVEKEHRVGEDSGIRCDRKFVLGDRLFFYERQGSALTYRGWKHKLSKYVRYRKRKGVKPFRVIITMDNTPNLNTVYRYCKEVTAEYPNLCLFLLGWEPDILAQYDACREDVWISNRVVDRRPEAVSLVD